MQYVKMNTLSIQFTEERYDYEYQNEECEIDENNNQLDAPAQNNNDDNIQSWNIRNTTIQK